LLYQLLKIPAKLALHIYCRDIRISHPELLKCKGPLLIACNHPNSFLDAIILSTLFKEPVHSLARGDVFNTKWKARVLRWLNMFPVYRTSEGAQNLEHNYSTFEACRNIFAKQGVVLIFSEGSCFNEWHLRPLKKGTARLALSSWEEGIPLTVLPAGINYHSFNFFGKNVEINFGKPIRQEELLLDNGFGKSVADFNELLQSRLQPLVYEIKKNDQSKRNHIFLRKVSALKKALLAIPALAGYLLHAPLYLPIKKFTWRTSRHNDHYDSILVGLLFWTYPLYLLLLTSILFGLTHHPASWLLLLILPFCAWSYTQLKRQF